MEFWTQGYTICQTNETGIVAICVIDSLWIGLNMNWEILSENSSAHQRSHSSCILVGDMIIRWNSLKTTFLQASVGKTIKKVLMWVLLI